MQYLKGALLFLVLSFITSPYGKAVAQEQTSIEAVEANQSSSATKVAVPSRADRAASFSAASTKEFYGKLTAEQEKNVVDHAYPLMAAKWPFDNVFVCWEETKPEFASQRALVRDTVEKTWQANSGLKFLGWEKCSLKTSGIHIAIRDEGPYVRYLGKFVDGKTGGMVLNFTYSNWSQACQNKQDYCNRVIAVHEFGHAIGFAHEQNRPDTPGECNQRQGSNGDNVSLTPWDAHSVMNYCNDVYSNNGVLSKFDIIAVQYIYGTN